MLLKEIQPAWQDINTEFLHSLRNLNIRGNCSCLQRGTRWQFYYCPLFSWRLLETCVTWQPGSLRMTTLKNRLQWLLRQSWELGARCIHTKCQCTHAGGRSGRKEGTEKTRSDEVSRCHKSVLKQNVHLWHHHECSWVILWHNHIFLSLGVYDLTWLESDLTF